MAGTRDPGSPGEEIPDGEIEEAEIDEAGDDLDEGDGAGDGEGQEPDADEEAEGQARNVGRQSRPRETIRNLRRRAQDVERTLATERANNDALNRRVQELERNQQRQPDPAQLAREEAEEAARVELMTPAQVARYYAEKSERRLAQALGQVHTQTQDRIDKAAFDALAERDPLLKGVSAQVETILAAERAAGRGTERLIIADFVIGRQTRERRQAQLEKQRRGANGRVNGQRTRPTGGGGDAPRQTGRQGQDTYEAALARVRGQPL